MCQHTETYGFYVMVEAVSGIYKIQSLVDETRCYVGSALNLRKRWWSHQSLLRNNKHHSIILQRHYNKHGLHNLVFIILELCDPQYLLDREQYYIDIIKPNCNISPTAGSTSGTKWTKEEKKRMSEFRKGKKQSKEHAYKRTRCWVGRKHKPESIEKMKKSHAGKGHTPEKQKLINIKNTGKKRSLETRQNISNSLLGHYTSDSTRKKISDSLKKYNALRKSSVL